MPKFPTLIPGFRLKKRSALILLLAAGLFNGCLWHSTEASPKESSYLPVDDSEYPYAGLPRIALETEDFADIRDRDTKIPALLQIYGKDAPQSEVFRLTVKGHGNYSWEFSKYSLKIEFENKVSLFGMPKDRDWLLISNHRDKTLMRNWITHRLSEALGAAYTPRSQFVELFVNRKYAGVFQLTESVKVAADRVDIPKNASSFLFEKTIENATHGDPYFISNAGLLFRIKSPKNVTPQSIQVLKSHIDSVEVFLQSGQIQNPEALSQWISVEDFVRYYWIQEFSKNIDGHFHKSLYFTWQKGSPIKTGPAWDFDNAYGLGLQENLPPEHWYTRQGNWFYLLFQSEPFQSAVRHFWESNKETFYRASAFADSAKKILKQASQNEYRRWPVLSNSDGIFNESYSSYDEAVDSLQFWISERFRWIESELGL